MNVLIVGGGGREHAIAAAVAKSPLCQKLFFAPGNAGTAALGENLPLKATDIDGVAAACREKGVDYVIVAPDDPLVLGMADALEEKGLRVFGPNRKAAMIEGSKVFAKNLMKKYGIPSARYAVFDNCTSAYEYIRTYTKFPAVIKADGLALGKGVVIAQTLGEAQDGLRSIMEDKIFGASGNQVVIEEFLTGPEVSVLCFTDGKTIVPMVSSMDHKRARDGDEGPNTGGMGTLAPNPFYTAEVAQECMRTIFLPTVEAMKEEGRPFKGCLYFGLMLTPDGPKVIEYNCRFGDPETQVVLSLLESDLLEIMSAVTDGRLSQADVRFSGEAAACVVLASGGYPGKYETGKEISGLEGSFEEGVAVYHAGTALREGKTVTSGGRVLGVTARAASLQKAVEKAYAAADKIHFSGKQWRTDIGRRALNALRK